MTGFLSCFRNNGEFIHFHAHLSSGEGLGGEKPQEDSINRNLK